jgi:hypothetical protein
MGQLCMNCVKEPALKHAIVELGGVAGDCAVCGTQGTTLIDCANPDFMARFRASYRYHFSEPEYNTHLGGDGLESLLFQVNPITNFVQGWNEAAYDDALMDMLQEGYEEGATKVSLFAGYTDGEQNMHLVALKRDTDERIRALKSASLTRNHYLLEEQARQLIEPLIAALSRTVTRDAPLHRARVGYVERGFPTMGWLEERHYRPYEGAQLGAPPPPMAAPGRMNRSGVSFLYLATTPETALAEIRPHPGHFCSVGTFRANRDLQICDLSVLDVSEFASDEKLKDFLLLKSVDDAFSIPVVPESRSEYHFPQLLADVFRHLKYDGIGFRSSVGSGKNVVFFDPSTFRFDAGSAVVRRVDSLIYTTSGMQTMTQNHIDYLRRADGSLV